MTNTYDIDKNIIELAEKAEKELASIYKKYEQFKYVKSLQKKKNPRDCARGKNVGRSPLFGRAKIDRRGWMRGAPGESDQLR